MMAPTGKFEEAVVSGLQANCHRIIKNEPKQLVAEVSLVSGKESGGSVKVFNDTFNRVENGCEIL